MSLDYNELLWVPIDQENQHKLFEPLLKLRSDAYPELNYSGPGTTGVDVSAAVAAVQELPGISFQYRSPAVLDGWGVMHLMPLNTDEEVDLQQEIVAHCGEAIAPSILEFTNGTWEAGYRAAFVSPGPDGNPDQAEFRYVLRRGTEYLWVYASASNLTVGGVMLLHIEELLESVALEPAPSSNPHS